MDFVEDWIITQTLGEGAYGEVKLVVNKITGENVAMKVIDTSKNENVLKEVKKEVAIHRILKDPNIIRFYGSRSHSTMEYIFLEYAPHGELFDRIEPDVGMPIKEAQKYMSQLLNGIEYLHSKGIAHRDIKPENLLLDEKDNLKLSDFGLATIFKARGKERALDKKCGTLPYVAPEVLYRPYAAQPADIWSCGIVLVAMLAGELPWDKAEESCPDYGSWVKGEYTNLSPWSKLDTLSLSLVRRILVHIPSARYTSLQIQKHRWFTEKPLKSADKKIKNLLKMSDGDEGKEGFVSLSQNIGASEREEIENCAYLSQPASLEDLLVSTQLLNTQSSSTQNCMQKLVRRMTRFIVSLDTDSALNELTNLLDKFDLTWKLSRTIVTVTTIDRRGNQLIFKSTALNMPNGTLLDFRLSRGCGIEFKRHFVSIRTGLRNIVSPVNSFYT